MTEAEYRALKIDSYSSLKVFIEDRKKYYRKYVLEEPVKDPDSQSLTFGSLVDCLLFTPHEFDQRFTLSVTDVPKGQYKKLIDELMIITEQSLGDNGEVTRDLEDMLQDAYKEVKYDFAGNVVDFKRDTFEVVKKKFIGSDLELYYRQLREAYGKTVIESTAVDVALAVINELKANPNTVEIINAESNSEQDVYSQFPLIEKAIVADGTTIIDDNYQLKGLLDKLIVSHKRKQIDIIDLKTAWDNEGEFLNNYFKYKYYIQIAVYYYLVTEWKKGQKGIEDYTVNFPKFVVADSNNYKAPLVYVTKKENFEQGMRGFIIRGKYYPGVMRAVSDLVWHKKSGIWNISKENYKNKGIVEITPFQN
jgi:hypothetical protein